MVWAAGHREGPLGQTYHPGWRQGTMCMSIFTVASRQPTTSMHTCISLHHTHHIISRRIRVRSSRTTTHHIARQCNRSLLHALHTSHYLTLQYVTLHYLQTLHSNAIQVLHSYITLRCIALHYTTSLRCARTTQFIAYSTCVHEIHNIMPWLCKT